MTRPTETLIHLMIPDFHKPNGLRGTAEFACNLDGGRDIAARMTQRTLYRDKATCADCLATPVHPKERQVEAAR